MACAGSVDVLRVVKMLLIHDIVEIDAGDVPFHVPATHAGQEERERLAAERLFGLLPDTQAAEFRELWCEFEAAESDDAKFAKALDRFQPMLHKAATGDRRPATGAEVRSSRPAPSGGTCARSCPGFPAASRCRADCSSPSGSP
ncbi:HD domain-containing protein [Thauera sp. 2A1]|nr:HD domain-containing protein [Thauera sp. 2A1]